MTKYLQITSIIKYPKLFEFRICPNMKWAGKIDSYMLTCFRLGRIFIKI